MSMSFRVDSKRIGRFVNGDDPPDPEYKAQGLEELKLQLIEGGESPSYLLQRAEDYDCVDELLEAEGAAYLVQYYTLLTEIRRLILVDSKDQFASFLRTRTNRDLVLEYPAIDVFMMLCWNSAIGCAAAFLEDPPIPLDVNSLLRDSLTPLHLAAFNLSYGMTNLLLHHGADPHINNRGLKTPLETALKAISDRCFIYKGPYNDWNTQKSILHMLYKLSMPKLKEPLDTVRLLSSHFTNVKDICFQYIHAGYLQHYTPLLLVASDKLMVSSTEGDFKTTPVGQHISQVLSNESLQQEICEHICEVRFTRPSKERFVKNLKIAWDVVETLGIFNGVLDRWCHSRVENVPMYGLPFNITGEQMKAASSGDNMQCLLPKFTFTSEAKVLPKRNFLGEQGQCFPILQPLTTSCMPRIGTSTFLSSSSVRYRSFHLNKAIQVKPSSYTIIALSRACAYLMRSAKKIIK